MRLGWWFVAMAVGLTSGCALNPQTDIPSASSGGPKGRGQDAGATNSFGGSAGIGGFGGQPTGPIFGADGGSIVAPSPGDAATTDAADAGDADGGHPTADAGDH